MKSIGDQIEAFRRAHPDRHGRPMSKTRFAELVSERMPYGEKVTRQNIDGLILNPGRVPRDSRRMKAIAEVLGKPLEEMLGLAGRAPEPTTAPAPIPIQEALDQRAARRFDSRAEEIGFALDVLVRTAQDMSPRQRRAVGELLALLFEDDETRASAEASLRALLVPEAPYRKRQQMAG